MSKVVDKGHKDAKLCKLEYEEIKVIDGNSLVKINLITGRHHQIRVQFKNQGYPLFGDQLYGDKNHEQIRLFAYKLEFIHPITKDIMKFELLPRWKEFKNETIIY